MDMKGRVAVITGSSRGIGAETARRLAARGCNIAVNYATSRDEAEAVAAGVASAGAEAIAVGADVADDVACRSLVDAALSRWGRIDYLVNNAGTTRFVAADDLDGLSGQDFLDVYNLNVVGPYQMIRAAATALREARGAVVNVSSTAGVIGVGSSLAYSASKAALNTVTLAMARHLAPEVRVNAVCPGMVDTEWNPRGMGQARYEQVRAAYEEAVPLRAVTTAEDVTNSIVYLLADATSVSGEMIMIDAGLHLGYAPLLPR